MCHLANLAIFQPAVLDNLEYQDLICLDDLQAVIGDDEMELAIFDLINRLRETGNARSC